MREPLLPVEVGEPAGRRTRVATTRVVSTGTGIGRNPSAHYHGVNRVCSNRYKPLASVFVYTALRRSSHHLVNPALILISHDTSDLVGHEHIAKPRQCGSASIGPTQACVRRPFTVDESHPISHAGVSITVRSAAWPANGDGTTVYVISNDSGMVTLSLGRVWIGMASRRPPSGLPHDNPVAEAGSRHLPRQ